MVVTSERTAREQAALDRSARPTHGSLSRYPPAQGPRASASGEAAQVRDPRPTARISAGSAHSTMTVLEQKEATVEAQKLLSAALGEVKFNMMPYTKIIIYKLERKVKTSSIGALL